VGESCSQGICCAGPVCGTTPACCQGTTCCSGDVCQPAHPNGLGQSYYDCRPLGTPGDPATYDSQMASEAAVAWSPSGTTSPLVCGAVTCVARLKAGPPGDCAVWCYSGTLAGLVGHSSVATIACAAVCPTVGGGTSFQWR
jgi:hypothetical protein